MTNDELHKGLLEFCDYKTDSLFKPISKREAKRRFPKATI